MSIFEKNKFVESQPSRIPELKEKLASNEQVICYWGVIPESSLHMGHLIPLLKMRDCIREGCIGQILLSDAHAYLENKFSFDKTETYVRQLKKILEFLEIDDSVEIVYGSNIQVKSPKYFVDLLKLSTLVPMRDSIKAFKKTSPLKQRYPKISSLIYPLMQALDETALQADIEIGRNDQQAIYELAHQYLPEMGYNPCLYLLYDMVPPVTMPNKQKVFIHFEEKSNIDEILENMTTLESLAYADKILYKIYKNVDKPKKQIKELFSALNINE